MKYRSAVDGFISRTLDKWWYFVLSGYIDHTSIDIAKPVCDSQLYHDLTAYIITTESYKVTKTITAWVSKTCRYSVWWRSTSARAISFDMIDDIDSCHVSRHQMFQQK